MHQEKPWESIALRISGEQDSQKLIELTQQLIRALDEDEVSPSKLETKDEEKRRDNVV